MFEIKFTIMFKSALLTISLSILLLSCTEVVFETPQPHGDKELKEIPSSLQGSYSFVVLNEQQVINITSDYFEGDDGRKFLSDSLVMKKVDDKYFINQLISKEGDTKGKWSVFIFEEKGCGFLKATAFIVSEDAYVTSMVESYNAALVGGGQEKQLIINPSDKEFAKLSEDRNATLSIILEKVE